MFGLTNSVGKVANEHWSLLSELREPQDTSYPGYPPRIDLVVYLRQEKQRTHTSANSQVWLIDVIVIIIIAKTIGIVPVVLNVIPIAMAIVIVHYYYSGDVALPLWYF